MCLSLVQCCSISKVELISPSLGISKSRWTGQLYALTTSSIPWLKWDSRIPPALIPSILAPPMSLNGPSLCSVTHSAAAAAAAAVAKSLQSCPTLCDPIDGSPPGSPVPGILQARTLEWVAISFSNAWKGKWSRSVSVWLFVTPWTAAYQAPPSMGFSRQEYWSGVPLLETLKT